MKKNLKKEEGKKKGYKLFNKIEVLKIYLNGNTKPSNKKYK
jgi:hypothetical protein